MENTSSKHFYDASIISAKVSYSANFHLSFAIFFDFKCEKVNITN